MTVAAAGFVWQFPHGTGWVPAIVSLAGTQQGQDLLSAHPVSSLATIPALCEPSLGMMAQPSLLWHGHRSVGWFSQTLLGVAALPGTLLLAALSLAGRENSTPARLGLGCPCLQEGMETDGADWSGCEQLY